MYRPSVMSRDLNVSLDELPAPIEMQVPRGRGAGAPVVAPPVAPVEASVRVEPRVFYRNDQPPSVEIQDLQPVYANIQPPLVEVQM